MDITKERPTNETTQQTSTHASVLPATTKNQNTNHQDEPSSVAILGLNRLQNDLLAQLFKSETSIEISVISDPQALDVAVRNCTEQNRRLLVLVDYRGTNPKHTFETLQRQAQKSTLFQVALFNVPEEINLEDFASWPQLSGAFLCNVDQRQLIKGVAAMLDGEIWLPRKLISKYVHKARAHYKPINGTMEKLTDREIEILKVMSTGARNIEIAESLNLSPHTVKTHVYNIFKKINASNRLQAVNWANEHIPPS